MAKPREFTTMPARAIADTRLTSLDLRCLMAIAIHDGMSLIKGKGAGCYARNSTLAEMVQTDISNFSKSLGRLLKFGYILREPQLADRRRFTLRVIYGDDNSWRTDQHSAPHVPAEIVGESTNKPPEMVGETTNYSAKLVGDGERQNGRNPPVSGPHYIPLNGEINSVETGELNSVETAQRAFQASRRGCNQIGELDPLGLKKDRAEARAASGVSITGRLARTFSKLRPEAQLSKFEDEFNKIGRDPEALTSDDRRLWDQWLFNLADEYSGEAIGYRAQRLYEEMAPY